MLIGYMRVSSNDERQSVAGFEAQPYEIVR